MAAAGEGEGAEIGGDVQHRHVRMKTLDEIDAALLLLGENDVQRLARDRAAPRMDERAVLVSGDVGPVDVGDDDHVGARRQREVDAQGAYHLAVDVIAIADAVWPKEHGDAARRGDGLADRHLFLVAAPEDGAPLSIDVARGHQERSVEAAEVVDREAVGEEALEAVDGEQAARQIPGAGELLEARRPQEEPPLHGPGIAPQPERPQPVDHLVRGEALGEERAGDGPGGSAHVNIRRDPQLLHRLHDAEVRDALRGPSRPDECDARLLSPHAVR